MLLGKEGPVSYKNDSTLTGEIELNSGHFTVLNDKVTVLQPSAATEYRYDFISLRKS